MKVDSKILIRLIQISFFYSALLLVSCQKELSVDSLGRPSLPADSLATFSILASGNNCSDAAVSGTFQVGTPFNGAAQLTTTVTVSKVGYWTYTTGVVNGYAFVGTGKFSVTGTQTITLLATGSPISEGINQFKLNIGNSNCTVPVTVTAAGSNTGTGEYYYKATIGGITYQQYVTDDNGYEAGSGLGGTDEVSFSATINPSSTPSPPGSTSLGIEKGLMLQYLSASDADFKAFFPIGDQPYAPPSYFDKGNGVIIGWSDPSGNYWDTQAGTGDQTGSTFKIISVKDSYDVLARYYIEVKMQFSCKLYNTTTGEQKTLTNGEMVSFFGKL